MTSPPVTLSTTPLPAGYESGLEPVAAVAVSHGGNLTQAIRHFGRPREDWIDLSTGINPVGYPVRMPPPAAWQRLPDDDDGLADVAADYFGCERTLPSAGSQAAIRMLPFLLAPGRVAIAALTYGEYAPAFERAGHRVDRYVLQQAAPGEGADANTTAGTKLPGGPAGGNAIPYLLDANDPERPLPAEINYLLVVNPNNPTTDLIPPPVLLRWRQLLAARGGALIVDEAFIDTLPGQSVASASGAPGLIVLRSIGKFFGLAGIRAGFVLGPASLLEKLSLALGPWTVNGPARDVIRQALQDKPWQDATRQRLVDDTQELHLMLHRNGLPARSTPLFAWATHPEAERIHIELAKQGVWTRLFATPPQIAAAGDASLRFGLPANPRQRDRVERALAALQLAERRVQ